MSKDARAATYEAAQRWRGLPSCGPTCSQECIDASRRVLQWLDEAIREARASALREALVLAAIADVDENTMVAFRRLYRMEAPVS